MKDYTSAYSQVISYKKEFKKMLRLLQGTRSRVLAADTQRYSMLLSSPYYPSMMMDGAEREIFLHSLWKGRGEDDRQIVESEIRSLLNGDISYFYYCLDGRNQNVGARWKKCWIISTTSLAVSPFGAVQPSQPRRYSSSSLACCL